jgi:hypothetical protein
MRFVGVYKYVQTVARRRVRVRLVPFIQKSAKDCLSVSRSFGKKYQDTSWQRYAHRRGAAATVTHGLDRSSPIFLMKLNEGVNVAFGID